MPDFLLRDYLSRIEGWIRSGQPARAVVDCRYLLTLYPECIKAHRLLGEAYLDMGMDAEAKACFERTLAGDPEDATAHIAMSLICDRQGMFPGAIQHMERAFDLAPGNREVRAQLQALYVRRGDSRSAGPALSRAAMARVYAGNGLLERAIAEFKEALHQNPDLPDVLTGLAEVQWRAGLGREAVETCVLLLEQLPGCLKALLIQGRYLQENGQEAEADAILRKAQALDPENRLAQAMMGERSPLWFTEILIPELAAEHDGEIGAIEEGNSMNWAEQAGSDREATPANGEQVPEAETVTGEQEIEHEGTGADSALAEAGSAATEDLIEVAGAEVAQVHAEGAEANTSEANLVATGDSSTETQEEAAPLDSELPDWLQESRPLAPATGEEVEVAPEPEWLEARDATRTEAETQAEPEKARADELEPPSWMEGLAGTTTAEEETALQEPSARADKPQREERAYAEPEAAGGDAAEQAASQEVPDWVRHMEEAVAREGPAATATVSNDTSAAAVISATRTAGASPAERERIGELSLLLQQEPRKYWARIELARLCSKVRDWDGALLQYEELIAGHKLIRAVILDLQGFLQEETDRVQVYRLLGDAYMESDEIDQALEMYRLARQILRKR